MTEAETKQNVTVADQRTAAAEEREFVKYKPKGLVRSNGVSRCP